MHRFSKSKFGDLEQDYLLRNNLLKKCRQHDIKQAENKMFMTLGGVLISYVRQSCKQFSREEAISLFSAESKKEYFKEIVRKTRFSGKLKKKSVFIMLIKAKQWKLLYSIFRR